MSSVTLYEESSSSHGVRAAWSAGVTVALAVALDFTTPSERQAAENARIAKQAAQKINRICSLPDDQREAELEKIKERSGMVLYCGNK